MAFMGVYRAYRVYRVCRVYRAYRAYRVCIGFDRASRAFVRLAVLGLEFHFCS